MIIKYHRVNKEALEFLKSKELYATRYIQIGKCQIHLRHLIFFSLFMKYKCVCAQSCLTATPWTIAHQAPLSMGCPSQEYWSGLPLPTPGTFLTQGSNPISCVSALAGGFFTTAPPKTPSKKLYPTSLQN